MNTISRYSIISSKSFKYVVTPSPDPNSIEYYKDLLFKNGITTVIRLCTEKKYDTAYLKKFGITVIDIPMDDGSVPTHEILSKWIQIITTEIKLGRTGIAVHCRSGLGRSPLFVCVGLIITEKIDPVGAVELVRKEIPKALNTKQINYICDGKIRKSHSSNHCTIM
jgi:protein-tyrosine phosphatase